MKRDTGKYEFLHKLRIGTYTVENHDLNKNSFLSFLRFLYKCPRLDHRARQRLFRNIYIQTILKNRKPIEEENIQLAKQIVQIFKGAC